MPSGKKGLLLTAPRTAQLFVRLRRDRPEITDPHSGSLPFLKLRMREELVGTRCARP